MVVRSITTAAHIPTGISLRTYLVGLLTNALPVDLSATMVLVFDRIGITDIQMFSRANNAPNAAAFMLNFHTVVTPFLRRRLFATLVIGVINAAPPFTLR